MIHDFDLLMMIHDFDLLMMMMMIHSVPFFRRKFVS
jgi:hypothetical protein